MDGAMQGDRWAMEKGLIHWTGLLRMAFFAAHLLHLRVDTPIASFTPWHNKAWNSTYADNFCTSCYARHSNSSFSLFSFYLSPSPSSIHPLTTHFISTDPLFHTHIPRHALLVPLHIAVQHERHLTSFIFSHTILSVISSPLPVNHFQKVLPIPRFPTPLRLHTNPWVFSNSHLNSALQPFTMRAIRSICIKTDANKLSETAYFPTCPYFIPSL